MKTAIVILSDPVSGGDEALGRAFNALAAAHERHAAGEQVRLLFAGAGTRWPGVLEKTDHPAHALFQRVAGLVTGVSRGCATAFGAAATGLPFLEDNPVPDTPGLPSLRNLRDEGFDVLLF